MALGHVWQLLVVEMLLLPEDQKVVNPWLFNPLKLASLKNKSDFDLIFEKNNLKVSSGDFDVLLVFKNKKEINYGFVFPKKNINLAVNRNFAKRSAKEMLKTLNPKKGFDIVFLVRKKIINFDKDKVKINFAELKRKIEFCF